jgi:hypothetical protein
MIQKKRNKRALERTRKHEKPVSQMKTRKKLRLRKEEGAIFVQNMARTAGIALAFAKARRSQTRTEERPAIFL